MMMDQFIEKCNSWASRSIPFLFVIDYEKKKPVIVRLEEAAEKGFYFQIKGAGNSFRGKKTQAEEILFSGVPMEKEQYAGAFSLVKKNILLGNSYLLNLTFPTPLQTNLTLADIYLRSHAKYKLFRQDEFVVFSPECFVKIENDMIFSYPMKGTIDAAIPHAEEKLLSNEKEIREHNTIVDLIRNDLSMISKEVEVTRFRYIDHLTTHRGKLLQVSSEIRGRLPENWKNDLGDRLVKLLPAGSISGAPKKKTVEIIAEAEGQDRGYYTGIFGVFDGKELDSGVMIRFVEQTTDGLRFRSGGGITGQSEMESEYNELLEKVYVPIV